MNLTPDAFERVLSIYAQLVHRRLKLGRDMAPSEYATIAAMIYKLSPCAVLVFGCGQDSMLWKELNVDGRTLFLEDKSEWSQFGRAVGLDVLDVRYECQLDRWMKPVTFPVGVTQDVLARRWDVVIVDGPMGVGVSPGREQSIYLANCIRRRHTAIVYVHDYARTWERACCDKYLGPPMTVINDLALWPQ